MPAPKTLTAAIAKVADSGDGVPAGAARGLGIALAVKYAGSSREQVGDLNFAATVSCERNPPVQRGSVVAAVVSGRATRGDTDL